LLAANGSPVSGPLSTINGMERTHRILNTKHLILILFLESSIGWEISSEFDRHEFRL